MSMLTWAIQAEDSPAHVARLVASVLLNEGVVDVAGDSFLCQENTGSDLNVRIGSGSVGDLAAVQGDSQAGQGVYIVESQDATDTVTLSAGDNSDPRIDRVGILVQDDEADSSGQSEAILTVVEGTPASSPSAPAEPDNFLTLALVEVAAQASAITNSDIDDTRAEAKLRSEVQAQDFQLLAEASANGSSTTLQVAGIPQSHRDLLVVFHGNHDNPGTLRAVSIRFNGDSGSNYRWHRIGTIGTAEVTGSESSSATSIAVSSWGGNAFRNQMDISIPNYAQAINHTCMITRGTASGTTFGTGVNTGHWIAGAAITSIQVIVQDDEWEAGSTIRVYGVGLL